VRANVQERIRYRISGSLFLIALAVIFLPMLFDDDNTPTPAIPAEPETRTAKVLAPYDEVVPRSDIVARVEALRSEVDEDGFSTATKERVGEPILLTRSGETEIWAVQAASFAKVENARNFRQELRNAGFEAFVSSAKNNRAVIMHRVAVGPLSKQADAEEIASRIGGLFGVTPQLVEMIP
jgi:DedD protein